MRGHGRSGAEAEVKCVLGRVCLGRVLLGGGRVRGRSVLFGLGGPVASEHGG